VNRRRQNDHKSALDEFDNLWKVSVGECSHANQPEEIDEDDEKIFHSRIQSGYLWSSQFMSFRKQITGTIIDFKDRQSFAFFRNSGFHLGI
jgi:hypothetical protein